MENSSGGSRRDIAPLELMLAVMLGCAGAAALSYARVTPLLSVFFAVGVMGVVAFRRWRIAARFSDATNLEAFAEDIYLLGYLLTLASLLGLAPRLLADEKNLFQIAGIKLVTTVLGLALMMVFRQTARSWRGEAQRTQEEELSEHQRRLSSCSEALSHQAERLSSTLGEVLGRFDPTLLVPVAEWSNKAGEVFAAAVRALESLPESLESGREKLAGFSAGLEKAKHASGEFASVISAGPSSALHVLAGDLARVSASTGELGDSMTAMQSDARKTTGSLRELGDEAAKGEVGMGAIARELTTTAEALERAQGALQSLSNLHEEQPNLPINRLIDAVQSSASETAVVSRHLDASRADIERVAASARELTQELRSKFDGPFTQHLEKVDGLHGLLKATGEQMDQTMARLERAVSGVRLDPSLAGALVKGLKDIHEELTKTNAQLHDLATRETSAGEPRGSRGFLSGLLRR